MTPRRPCLASPLGSAGLLRSVLFAATVAVATAPAALPAQTVDIGDSLSLDRALEIAFEYNPRYRLQRNALITAQWDVRSAVAQLFPSASIGGGLSWQGAGEQQLGSLTLEELGFADQPSFLFSNYTLGLAWSLNGAKLFAPEEAGARRDATLRSLEAREDTVTLRVTQLYLDALRQSDAVALAEAQLERASYNQRLARAQEEVGVGLALDTRRAEVEVGRAEVAVLTARNATEIARVRLFEELGIPYDPSIPLSTTFALEEPLWDLETLTDYALAANPLILRNHADRRTASQQVKIARSSYFPTLSVSAGWSGFTREASNTAGDEARLLAGAENARLNCIADNDLRSRLSPPLPPLDCSRFAVSDGDLLAIRSANDQFPFDFTQSPPSISLSLSLPIFQGLTRQRQLEAAKAASWDLEERVRATALGLRAEVRTTLGNVRTNYQAALIEQRNQALADEQLRMARERFAVGELSFAELADAETGKAQADRDLITAIYAYHDAVALLEAIVGAALR